MLGFDPLSTRPISDIAGGSAAQTQPQVRVPTVTRIPGRPPLNTGYVTRVGLLSGLLAPPPLVFNREPIENPARRRHAGFTEVAQSLLLTTLAVAATAAIFRVPLSTNPVQRADQGLNETTQVSPLLQVQQAAPFRQLDWLNPVRPVYKVQPTNNGRVLVNAQPAPFAETDWQNPVLPKKALQESTLGRLPDSIPSGLQPPFYQEDWQNPVLGRRVPQADSVGRLPTIPRLPFTSQDWPNPRGAAHALQEGTLGRLPDSIQRSPFAQTDWQNLSVKKFVQQPNLVGTRLVLGAAEPLPKNNYNWPNPIQPRRALQEGTQGYLPALIPAPAPSVMLRVPTVRTLPAVPRALQESTLGRLPSSIPSGAPPPFSQKDWANPTRPIYKLQPLNNGRALGSPNPPPTSTDPFRQSDWPVPAKPIARQQFFDTAVYMPGDPMPVGRYEWPNPVRAKYVHPEGSFGRLANLPPTVVAPPFAQKDWQNPTRLRRALQEGTKGRLANLPPAAFTKPFLQSEWWYPVRNKALDPSQQFEVTIYGPAPSNNALTRVPTVTQIPKRRVPEQVGTSGRIPALIPPPALIVFPFRNTDWPNPQVKRGLDPSQVFEHVIYISPDVASGATQSRVPVITQIPKRRVPEQIGSAGRIPALIPPPPLLVLPFNQKDWQLPRGRVASRPETSLGRLPTLPVPPLLVLPFRQLDWPNPTRAKITRQSFTNYVIPTVSGVWNTIEPCTGAGWSNAAPANTDTWSGNSIADSPAMTTISPCSPQTWTDNSSGFPNSTWEDVDDI